jgi:hypothetical protein
MQKITTSADLKGAIQELEMKQSLAWTSLKDEFLAVVETLKPVNILKEAVKNILASPDLKSNIVKAGFGLATGAVTTKLFMGKVTNPISRMLAGAVIGMATSAGSSKAMIGIKSVGAVLLKKIFQKSHSEEDNGKHF